MNGQSSLTNKANLGTATVNSITMVISLKIFTTLRAAAFDDAECHNYANTHLK